MLPIKQSLLFFFACSQEHFWLRGEIEVSSQCPRHKNLRQHTPNHTDQNHTERHSAKLCNRPKPDTAARRLLISSPLSARQGEHTGTCWGQKTQHVENSTTAAIRMQQCQSQDAAGIQAALYKSSPTDTCMPLPILCKFTFAGITRPKNHVVQNLKPNLIPKESYSLPLWTSPAYLARVKTRPTTTNAGGTATATPAAMLVFFFFLKLYTL